MKVLRQHLGLHESKLYDLVAHVVAAKVFAWSDVNLVATYQKLFITQAALCELYFEYEETSDLSLIITPVSAYLVSTKNTRDEYLQGSSTAVNSEYHTGPNIVFFSNPDNFFGVTEARVQVMLDSFWQNYQAKVDPQPALAVLGLSDSDNPSWQDVRARYRSLAAKHHPDRGGDAGQFVEIRAAYEQLKGQYLR